MRTDEPGQQTVDDVYEPDVARSKIVEDALPLADVVDLFEHQTSLEAVIVVNAGDQFVGLVQRSDLAGWLNANLAGPRADRLPLEGLDERLANAYADEACGPGTRQAAVHEDEPVDHALRKMMETSCSVLAVVGEHGTVKGDVRLTRLLRVLSR